MLVCGLDFETTFMDDRDAKSVHIVEIGAILWDTERKQPLEMMSRVVKLEAVLWDPRITECTGLIQDDVNRRGVALGMALDELFILAREAEFWVAHNGNQFDRPVLEGACARVFLPMPARPWIDTTCDVPYPKKIETRKLAFLGPEHGFMNPFSHRALFDVISMLKILSFYPIEEVVRRSQSPKALLRAMTQKPWEDQGKSNDLAKARGFRWDGVRKIWSKTVLAEEVAAELLQGPLKVVEIKEQGK